ncbi:septum site-determining protein MinD [Sporobacter termitidis DSM 10068]|uniref:Septum site-determining protein MinD n=1 Tax=Sporobacter termitidis DSM 10068 TaxID=1123282 RepID=A0A1M5VNJ6_9FIRM|nr:septum site-determining protein MinD [Sporobacter termitidis]SHH76584.1 septum site-determining protein MinD [Sporobacter termitidis DSM 10068]
MGKVIVVASGKGGTGKTTSVGAISSCLAALGHKTLCIDCDAGLRNLDIIIGMTEYTVTDFFDVLQGRTELLEACAEHPRIKNLYFLPAPAFHGPEEIDADDMAGLTAQIREQFDYCLIDAPAGIGPGFRLAAQGADMALIVTVGDMSSMRDGQRVAEELRSLGVRELRLIVNRVSGRNFRKLSTTVDDVIDAIGARLVGLVEEDEEVFLASNSETPLILYENKRAALQFLQIARRLTGERIPLVKRWSRA